MDPEAELVVSEAELSVTEAELGADFITVELDTQPIEYVVKWAEVGSKFTISCLKTDQSELGDALKNDSETELTEELRVDQSELQMDAGDTFLAPYEEVYCDPCDPCEVTHSVEVRTDWDSDSDPELDPGLVTDLDQSHMTEVVLESSQPDSDQDQAESDSEERQHRCSFCGKVYSHASSLYRHQQSHTGKTSAKRTAHESRPHTCPHCGLSFKGSRMLGSHLRLHGKRRIHPCNICGKEFNHSSSLSRHRLIHKKGKGLRDHPKMAAPQSVSAHSNMAALHRGVARKHRGKRSPAPSIPAAQTGPAQKLYACPQCDMSFKTSTQLSKHQVTHVRALLGGYPPKDKENLSESQSDLKIRLKLCSRDQPNVYALCEKRRRGLATPDPSDPSEPSDPEEEGAVSGRAGGRRHGCSQCGRRFGHASALTRHLQTHLKTRLSPAPRRNNKTYTCLTCGKVFLHSSSFSRHKRAHREQQQRLEAAPLESESD